MANVSETYLKEWHTGYTDGSAPTFETQLAAANAASGGGTVILHKGTHTLTNNRAIDSDVCLIAHRGALITGAYTLTINGPFEAGDYQVFDTNVTAAFADGACQEMKVAWWKTGSDHTAAVRAAIAAAVNNGSTLVRLPDTCTITDTISVPYSMIIAGKGWGTTVTFNPASPSGKPAFQTKALSAPYDSSYNVFRDFSLDCNGVGEYGIKVGEDDGGSNVWYGEQCMVNNVYFQNYVKAALWLRRTIRFKGIDIKTYCSNGAWGDAIDGLLVDQATNNIDGNNLATFINCNFGNSRRHAVNFHNSGRNFTFIGCDFEATGWEAINILKDNALATSYMGNINFYGCWCEAQNLASGRTNGSYYSAKINWPSGAGSFEPFNFIGTVMNGAGTGNKELYANNARINIVGGYVAAGGMEAIGLSRIKLHDHDSIPATLTSPAVVVYDQVAPTKANATDQTIPSDTNEHDVLTFDIPRQSLGSKGGFEAGLVVINNQTWNFAIKDGSNNYAMVYQTISATGTHLLRITGVAGSQSIDFIIEDAVTGTATKVTTHNAGYDVENGSTTFKFVVQKANAAGDSLVVETAWVNPWPVSYS